MEANRLSLKKKTLKTMADLLSDFNGSAYGQPNPETDRRNLWRVDDTDWWDKNSLGSQFSAPILHSKAPYHSFHKL